MPCVYLKRDAAEDVLQEAYVTIWKNAASYHSEVDGQTIKPMTWLGALSAIVRKKALDAYRARARRKESGMPDSGEMDENEMTSGTPQAPSAMQLLEHRWARSRPGYSAAWKKSRAVWLCNAW